MSRGVKIVATSIAVAAFWPLTACGGEDTPRRSSGPAAPVMGHVHGVDVDPRDESLYVATHEGIMRARAGGARLEPISESRQDFMGFTIDSGRFLGSGHPAPGDEGQPVHLGLIESTDKGRTWAGVSLSVGPTSTSWKRQVHGSTA